MVDGGTVSAGTADAVEAFSESVHEHVRDRPLIRKLVQLGWVAKAVVYMSLGWAAIEISWAKTAADDAEYTGIVTALADGTFTRFLLALIAVGLTLYISFRLLSVALIDDVDPDAWAHRVAYLASAATYVTVAWAAGDAVINGPRPDGESKVESISRSLLRHGVGRVAVVIGGLVAIGVGVYFIIKGLRRRFMRQIEERELGERERWLIEISGAIGWVGRGVTVLLVAVFVTWAAAVADSGEVKGLDSSIHRTASGPVGQVVVFAVGICLLIYAAFCLISARRRRLAWQDNPEPTPAQPELNHRSTL